MSAGTERWYYVLAKLENGRMADGPARIDAAHRAVPAETYLKVLSLSLYYMYTRYNGVPIGLFRQFGLDLETCFDVLAVRSEVQTQG